VPIGETIGAPISSAYENPMRRLIASTSPSDQSKRQYIHNGGHVPDGGVGGR
jgi:hypothetical protein